MRRAQGGKQARLKVGKESFGLVLTDLRMPRMQERSEEAISYIQRRDMSGCECESYTKLKKPYWLTTASKYGSQNRGYMEYGSEATLLKFTLKKVLLDKPMAPLNTLWLRR